VKPLSVCKAILIMYHRKVKEQARSRFTAQYACQVESRGCNKTKQEDVNEKGNFFEDEDFGNEGVDIYYADFVMHVLVDCDQDVID